MSFILAGMALEDAKAGDIVRIDASGIYNLKKEKYKKLKGKPIDEEKTELEKWFDLLEITKKEENKKTGVNIYSSGSAMVVSGGFANIII